MKVYVSVDLEGIGGIIHWDQCRKGTVEYAEARQLLTKEVNAVVEGLLEAGASRIIVRDAHGSGFNFLLEDLHPGAEYVIGAPNKPNRFPKLSEGFDLAILMGYHAMGGTASAIRDHTMSSQNWTRIWLNGKEVGEIWIDALLFSLHKVPVMLVTGDNKTCEETRAFLPHSHVYETKEAFGRHCALIKPPARVRQEIREAVKLAVHDVAQANLVHEYSDRPHELMIEYMHSENVDAIYADGARIERVDGRKIIYRDEDLLELFRRVF